jgi:uncharacterized protein (TIRG00374 family)
MKKIRFLIGLVISIFFLYVVLRKADVKEVFEIIKSMKWAYLIIGLILTVIAIFIRSKRWKVLLGDNGSYISLTKFFESLCAGQMTNNVLPFRVGDFAQAYFLGRKGNLSKSMVFSTVVMERLLDIVPPTLIIVVGSFFVILPEQIGIGRVLVFLAVLLVIAFLIFKSKTSLQKFIEKILPSHSLKDKFHRLIENFYSGLDAIKKKEVLLRVTFYTVFVWLTYFMVMYSCLLCLDININIPSAMLVMAITAISVTIPSSPGYVGTWEFFVILGLGVFHIDKSRALSFALIYHLVSLLMVTLIGLWVVIRSGLSFSQVQQQAEQPPNTENTTS